MFEWARKITGLGRGLTVQRYQRLSWLFMGGPGKNIPVFTVTMRDRTTIPKVIIQHTYAFFKLILPCSRPLANTTFQAVKEPASHFLKGGFFDGPGVIAAPFSSYLWERGTGPLGAGQGRGKGSAPKRGRIPPWIARALPFTPGEALVYCMVVKDRCRGQEE